MENDPEKLNFQRLLSEFKEQKIRIPEFQREFVWNKSQIKKLLNSIYNQYPIGSFIFWVSTDEIKCINRVGNYEFENEPPKGYPLNYVIDGQQRILSLIAAIKEATIDRKEYKFYFDLKNKKFLEERELGEEKKDYVPLSKIFLNKIEYSEFMESYETEHKKLLNDLYLRFNSYPFSIIYVRNENSLKNICDVFHVINTTGKRLTPVALVISKSWSEGFDLRKNFNGVHEKFKDFGEIPEYRLLQLAAVILHDKKCKKDIIVNHLEVLKLEDLWGKLIKSLELSIDFVNNELKVKSIRYVPFDIIFIPLSYFYYKNGLKKENLAQKEFLKKWFWLSGLSRWYDSAVEGKIEKDLKEFDKILKNEKPSFNYPLDWAQLKEMIKKEKFSLRSAFSKTILSLYSYKQPLSLKDGSAVQFSSYSNLNRKNLHHIFPRNYIKNNLKNLKEFTNNIINLCFIPAIHNIEVSDDPPKDYFEELKNNNKNKFKESLQSNFIGNLKDFGIEDNNFEKFLDKRAEVIKDEFKRLIK